MEPENVSVTEKSSELRTPKYRMEILWYKVVLFVLAHIGGVYGLYLLLYACMWKTVFWSSALIIISFQGVTAGVHRLWSHRAFKATLPLKIFLMLCQSMTFQTPIYSWARDHRLHHKCTDTDADPYNAERGFFFSHIGWLVLKKHPDVINKGKTIDISDLLSDPVIRFQKRYYAYLVISMCFVFPMVIPWYLWGEKLWNSWYACSLFVFIYNANSTALINSLAHKWGTKPYDGSIYPVENRLVSFFAFGEGWHNYHHVFPQDYKAAELGNYELNFTTMFIDLFALVGLAYDLKTVSMDKIKKRSERTGDGSRIYNKLVDTNGDMFT